MFFKKLLDNIEKVFLYIKILLKVALIKKYC